MRVIGFDTATDDTVVAALDDGHLTFEEVVPPAGRPVHSQALLERVAEATRTLGGWDRVDRIAVGIGPGTFTGIRIGIATAAGLAASAGCDLAGVSTLAALARGIGGKSAAGEQTASGRVVPLLDARRGEVFGGIFDGRGEPVSESFVCPPEDVPARLGRNGRDVPSPIVAGPGAVRFRDELIRCGLETEPAESPVHRLTGRPFCELGAAAETTGETPKPLYLRIPDAQLWLERDGKTVR